MKFAEWLETLQTVFLDTAPVIYFGEKNPAFSAKVQPLFLKLDEGALSAIVSPITLAECLVLPYKISRPDIAHIFSELLVNSDSVLFYPMDEVTADKAADFRAQYNLTLTDAFQLAVAIQSECDGF